MATNGEYKTNIAKVLRLKPDFSVWYRWFSGEKGIAFKALCRKPYKF